MQIPTTKETLAPRPSLPFPLVRQKDSPAELAPRDASPSLRLPREASAELALLELAPGTIVGGRYELLRRARLTSWAQAWRAKEGNSSLEVMVELANDPNWGPAHAHATFAAMAQASAQLESVTPRVVRVLATGFHGGIPFIVTEHIEAHSLAEAVRVGGPMSPDEFADVLDEVAYALDAAHAHHIAHGALDADRVLLVAGMTRERLVKIAGFGAASAASEVTGAADLRALATLARAAIIGPFAEGRAWPPSTSFRIKTKLDAWFARVQGGDPELGSAVEIATAFRFAIREAPFAGRRPLGVVFNLVALAGAGCLIVAAGLSAGPTIAEQLGGHAVFSRVLPPDAGPPEAVAGPAREDATPEPLAVAAPPTQVRVVENKPAPPASRLARPRRAAWSAPVVNVRPTPPVAPAPRPAEALPEPYGSTKPLEDPPPSPYQPEGL